MFLQQIEIKNYKSIKDINIDLRANKNGIEKDIIINRFKLIDDKIAIPSISVLVGRNSIGKSTIIESIALVSDIVTDFINKHIVNLLIRKETFSKQNEVMLTHKIDIPEMHTMSQELVKEITNSIDKKKGLYFEKYRILLIEWYIACHKNKSQNLDEPIQIKLLFIADNQKINLIIKIMPNGELIIESKGNIEWKEIIQYFKHSILPNRTYKIGKMNSPFDRGGIVMSKNFFSNEIAELKIAIVNLIKFLGAKKTEKLLKLADDNILEIKHKTQINGLILISQIILENGSSIFVDDLSNGTQNFIRIAEAIIRSYKSKKSFGLIMIDEIETNLHKELVQLIFLMLAKVFKEKNKQSILTTHNIHFLNPEISPKQIFSFNREKGKHIVEKTSSFMKSHENLITKYDFGLISPYPDSEFARNTLVDIFSDE